METDIKSKSKKERKTYGRSLSDEEYEAIFKAVLERYPPSPELYPSKDDAFETIIEADEDFASQYVEAFVNNSQTNNDKSKDKCSKNMEREIPMLDQASQEHKESGEAKDLKYPSVNDEANKIASKSSDCEDDRMDKEIVNDTDKDNDKEKNEKDKIKDSVVNNDVATEKAKPKADSDQRVDEKKEKEEDQIKDSVVNNDVDTEKTKPNAGVEHCKIDMKNNSEDFSDKAKDTDKKKETKEESSGEDETEDRNDSLINDGDDSKSPPKRPPGKRAESAKPATNKVLNVATKSNPDSTSDTKKKRGRPKQKGFAVDRLSGVKSPLASPVSSSKIPQKEKGSSKKKKMKERVIKETGTWVQCMVTSCMKWRYLGDVHDPATLPEKWFCSMNADNKYNSCEKTEQSWDEDAHSKDYFFTKFAEGSIVWARMAGFPWWPAMIEIDPDIENYFQCKDPKKMVATSYHVVYFDDKVSRAWIKADCLKIFNMEKTIGSTTMKGHNYKKAILVASEKASEAQQISLKERLETYGFAQRYRGRWGHDILSDSQDHEIPGTSKGKSKIRKKDRDSISLLKSMGISEGDTNYYLENQDTVIKNFETAIENFISSQSSHKSAASDSEYSFHSDSSKEKQKSKKRKRKGESPKRKTRDEKSPERKKRKQNRSTESENETTENFSKVLKDKKKKPKKKKQVRDENTSKHTRDEKENPDSEVKKPKIELKQKISASREDTKSDKIEKEGGGELVEKSSKIDSQQVEQKANSQKECNSKKKETNIAVEKPEKDNNRTKEKSATEPIKEVKKKPAFSVPVKKKPTTFSAPVKKSVPKLDSVVKAGAVRIIEYQPEVTETCDKKEDIKKNNAVAFDNDIFTMEISEVTEKNDKVNERKEENTDSNNIPTNLKSDKSVESVDFDDLKKTDSVEGSLDDSLEFEYSQTMNAIIKGVEKSIEADELESKNEKSNAEEKEENVNCSPDSDMFDFEKLDKVSQQKESQQPVVSAAHNNQAVANNEEDSDFDFEE